MATYREAVAAFGIPESADTDLVIAFLPAGGGDMEHRLLSEIGDQQIATDRHVYLAGGRFKSGTVQRFKGRSWENVAAVPIIAFDFDLGPYLGMPSEKVYAMTDGTIASHCERLRQDVANTLAQVGVDFHGLEYSGHGVLGWIRIGEHTADDLEIIRDAYKAILEKINALAGFELADRAVSDAGTRVYRLPLSRNVKAGASRETRIIWDRPGSISVAELAAIAGVGDRPKQPILRALPTPTTGSLSDDDARTIVEIVAPHWQQPHRHVLARGLGGWCAKAGIKEVQATAIVEALASGDEEAAGRIKDVRTSYAAHELGKPVIGYYDLAQILSATDLARLDAIGQKVYRDQQPRLKMGGGRKRTEADRDARLDASFTVSPFPVEAWHGWFADYRDLYAPTTEAAHQFHLAAALTIVASTIGRRARLDVGDGLYPNVYALILGPSGSSRKDSAIKPAISMPAIWQASRGAMAVPFFSVARDVSSAEGLVKTLQDNPTSLVYLSEINALLLNARRKGTSTILDKLIEAWDAPVVLENNSKLAPGRAVHPTLSVISAGQPGRFADMIGDEDIFSGFANRWLYVPGVGGDLIDVQGSVPAADTVRLYQEIADRVRTLGEDTRFPFDSDALAMNRDWYRAMRGSMGRDEAEDSMRQRHQTIAHKVALIYAVTDGSRQVEAQHLAAAIALIEWSWENVRRYMQSWGVGPTQKLERRIIDLLENGGPMTRRQLQRACSNRKWTSFEFGRTLDSMIRNDVIAAAGDLLGIPEGD